ncbi:hypothetical protein ACFYTG_55290 [Streptomyces mirabilis]|uniref:hypothetical protein n=1 Tax=Streptomyces mirabilis TaxID=68239 RepID=UPI0036885C3F
MRPRYPTRRREGRRVSFQAIEEEGPEGSIVDDSFREPDGDEPGKGTVSPLVAPAARGDRCSRGSPEELAHRVGDGQAERGSGDSEKVRADADGHAHRRRACRVREAVDLPRYAVSCARRRKPVPEGQPQGQQPDVPHGEWETDPPHTWQQRCEHGVSLVDPESQNQPASCLL